MSILVVGGAGYIGSHTAKHIAGIGGRPIVLDNLSTGHDWAVRWGPLEIGDLADRERVRAVLEAHRITAVVHFAAHAYVGESIAEPRKYFRNNVANTLNLLDAMLDVGVKTIVFSSSCTVYGDAPEGPLSEDAPTAPVNPYGESKLMVEKVLRWYERSYGLRWIALRYFNAAGADPDAEIGEVHDPETHLLPLTIDAALERRPPLKIFGSDYPTPDGTAVRDYIHVADLADAHQRALAHLEGGGACGALNLGTGRGHSVREVVETVERIGGRPVPRSSAPRREGNPPSLVADARRAGIVLGWKPKFPDLETIIQHAWRWHTRADRPAASR